MKKDLILTLFVMLLFWACAKEESQNVNQDSIFTIYELFYNKEKDITTARTVFRFGGAGGTLLDLNEPAISTFNGDELLYNPVSGFHLKEYPGLTTSGTFVYTDLDNNTFTNQTATIDPINFKMIDTISAGSAYVFEWNGNPLGEDETVTLTINGSQQGNVEIFTTTNLGTTEIVLESNRLQNLGLGNAECELTRIETQNSVDEGTSKGGRMAVWYTDSRTIFIDN